MSNTENEFVDPLEEIDPIMKEVFSEEDIIENDNIQSLDDELDAMLDDIEEDDSLPLDDEDSKPTLNDELETLDALDSDELDSIDLDSSSFNENLNEGEESESNTIESIDEIETPNNSTENTIEVTESVYSIENEPNENLITNDFNEEDDYDNDVLLEDLDDSILSNDSYSVEEAYPGSEVPEAVTEESVEELIEDIEEESTHGNLAKVEFPELQSNEEPKQTFSQNLFNNIPIEVSVELGRTRISLKEIYELGKGSIIELEKLTGETLDLIVNDQVIAKGEVVTVDNKYGLRINELSEEKPEI